MTIGVPKVCTRSFHFHWKSNFHRSDLVYQFIVKILLSKTSTECSPLVSAMHGSGRCWQKELPKERFWSVFIERLSCFSQLVKLSLLDNMGYCLFWHQNVLGFCPSKFRGTVSAGTPLIELTKRRGQPGRIEKENHFFRLFELN